MKKVLILGAPFDLYQGGAEYQYKLIEEGLRKKYEVKYLFRHPFVLDKNKYITFFYRFRKRYNRYIYTDALAIYKLIKNYSPDIIYKRGVNYITAVGVYYSLKHSCKMILGISSSNDLAKFNNSFRLNKIPEIIDRRLSSYTIRNASIIICQANYQQNLLEKNFYRDDGIIVRNFHPRSEIPILKSDKFRIIWIANYKSIKRPELFIKLAREFKAAEVIEFIMVGRTPGKHGQALNSNQQIPDNLKILGEISIDRVNELLASSHILINTSIYEGFPNTFIQAWLHEVVVVSLDVDPDNILKKENIGYQSGSIEQMVEDIKKLKCNEQLRKNMARRSRLFAEEAFDYNSNLSRLIEAFG